MSRWRCPSKLNAMYRLCLPLLWPVVGACAVLSLVGCTSGDPPDEPPSRGLGQCPIPLTYAEMRKQCTEGLKKCLDAPPQSEPGGSFGHSFCFDCQDECMRLGGVWPTKLKGRACL